MFRRKANLPQQPVQPTERITSVVADGINLRGKITGSGGVRIEGAYDGEIELDGLLVIGQTGRVTCPQVKARHVIVAGALRGDILAEKVEIRATGRVWGDVTTMAMSTEEGAFLRGQIQMEEKVALGIEKPLPPIEELPAASQPEPAAELKNSNHGQPAAIAKKETGVSKKEHSKVKK
jgi:cytoskeletal protein CcmA (bactofilin family)